MRRILVLLLVFKAGMALSQQEAIYTHYGHNLMAINPAYAGYENKLTATMMHLSQWISIPGAPIFQTLSGHSPIGKNVGLGLSFVNNHIGPERNIAIKAYYSYTIRSEEKLKISFGFKAGLNELKIGLNTLELDNPDDPAFRNNIESALLPNFGFGIFAYTENYYFGFSIPDLIQHDYLNNTIFSSSDLSLNSKKYYLLGGASFQIADKIQFKPSSLMSLSKTVSDSTNISIKTDLTALFVVDQFAGGIMISTDKRIAFLAGLMLTKDLEFGYSYNFFFSNNATHYNGGSHEIILKYSFKNLFVKNRDYLSCPTFQ